MYTWLGPQAAGGGARLERTHQVAVPDYIDLKRSDLDCMNGLNWLNDEVINFYMGLLQQRELRLNPGERSPQSPPHARHAYRLT
eukprot:1178932-Prorocentrum_minimum.AAC.2